MEKRELMTEAEIHDFGVEIVFNQMKKDGYEIVGVNTTLGANPQINAKKDGQLHFVVVRTACYPEKGKIASEGEFFQILDFAKEHDAMPHFAPVGICYADAKDEKEAGMAYKGAPFNALFNGLLIMTTTDKVKVLNS